MNMPSSIVVFALDERRFALGLSAVVRIVRAAEIQPLPHAPAIVLGLINVGGQIIPVFDVRKRFGLPARAMELTDQVILARTARRTVAVIADQVLGVVEPAETEILISATILPGLDYVEGVVKLSDGLVFIHDLETFLSLNETRALDAALTPTR